MDRKLLSGWVQAYERLWRTPGTDGLSEIFADDANYSMGPFARSETGIEDVARLWDEERKGPDEPFEMTWEIVAVDGDTGIVRVEVRYGPPRQEHYRDLWVVRLRDDGRCFHFEEWPQWPDHGTTASGD
jgi:hypothetical protein